LLAATSDLRDTAQLSVQRNNTNKVNGFVGTKLVVAEELSDSSQGILLKRNGFALSHRAPPSTSTARIATYDVQSQVKPC